ncbi:hypothetical protein GSI_08716 [Ganoderma sinense ZZ0214-1]|uniref:DUF6534 domain-containing protein n=1 Tax=Ganoderma sinense ZZ0214-1 TaxID=1077348 RepID=A0A2G8S4H6_9APHY|nr:hypothetical protein GSI_08716 [Ganoderma sinense ZZ0214-1]
MTPAEQLARVKEALGCIIVGLILSSILYGITVLQTYIYYRENSKDLVRVKVLVSVACALPSSRAAYEFYIAVQVAVVFFLDTAASASITAGAFIFFVNDFGRQATLVNTPPSLALETGANALIATLTQFFFAYRLYIVSRKNRGLVSVIIVLAVLSLGPAAWTAAFFLGASSLFNLGLPKVRAIASLATGLPAICDILIAWGLCYYLHTSRSGFKKSDTVIDRLMLYTIECGALTALCQTCIMVTFAALPGRIIFIPFQLVVGKLYCNALLASLNVRWRIRELNSVATPDAATRGTAADPLASQYQYRGTRTVDKDRDKDKDRDASRSPTIDDSFCDVAAGGSTTMGTGMGKVRPDHPFTTPPITTACATYDAAGADVGSHWQLQAGYSPDVFHTELHSESYRGSPCPGPGMALREMHSRRSSSVGVDIGVEEQERTI